VIERAAESLGDSVDLLVLTGEAPAPGDALTPITEPFHALEYSEDMPANFDALANDLRFTARSLLGRDPDIWHIHNHSLGKNGFTPRFVQHLADAGCRLLLQPHDFAEDGRPDNYRLLREQLGAAMDTMLYPNGNHIWYAPINYRDKAFLEGIGLTHVHELPNSVAANVAEADKTVRKTIVYPARAIRRKNMGEFLLWSLLAPEGFTFQSTLAPQNPIWGKKYNDWVAFANELNLPVEFDVGRTHDFAELVQQSEALISTSIAEGFGLAFLEPWLEGKLLIGRKIPEITADFEEEGLDLSTLYSSLPVPLEWAGEKLFFSKLEAAMRYSYEAYSRDWSDALLDTAKEELVSDGTIDFGVLDEELQRNVIRHLADNKADRSLLPEFRISGATNMIRKNQRIVEEKYSVDAYAQRLLDLYTQLAALQPDTATSAAGGNLLDAFLQPGRFNLLRT
jgi:hypothetical protein